MAIINQMSLTVNESKNIIVKSSERFKGQFDELKTKGNELYNARDFYNALLHY